MNIDIKHKHAGHVIIIEGQAFKANDQGQWDLTEIWRTLKLPKGKAPAQWRTKQAQRLEAMQNLHSSNGAGSRATKRATIAYAAWVSPEFEELVYDAFEAILEKPEVALIVAEVMTGIGHAHSADILKRITENQDRNAILRSINRSRKPRPLTAVERETQRLTQAASRRARKEALQAC